MFSSSLIPKAAVAATVLAGGIAGAATPSGLLAGYVAESGTPASPERGRQLFVNRHGHQWAGGRRSRSAPPEDRITRSTWFQGEHDEISPATWRRVKNPSNCAACHIHANQGVFDEHDVRIPR